MFHVVLIRPEIPPNTGNIGRLTLGTGTRLHIVGDPLFDLDRNTAVKRAGLDYWERVDWVHHSDWESYREETEGPRVLLSKFGDRTYTDYPFSDETHLIFGGETQGAPKTIHKNKQIPSLHVPMNDKIRSFNLANTVGIVLFEALRQNGFLDLHQTPYC